MAISAFSGASVPEKGVLSIGLNHRSGSGSFFKITRQKMLLSPYQSRRSWAEILPKRPVSRTMGSLGESRRSIVGLQHRRCPQLKHFSIYGICRQLNVSRSTFSILWFFSDNHSAYPSLHLRENAIDPQYRLKFDRYGRDALGSRSVQYFLRTHRRFPFF
jgi:hypothetical protein